MFEAYNLESKHTWTSCFHHNWHHCLSPIFNTHHFWTFPYEAVDQYHALGHQPWLALGGENPGAQVSLFDAAGVAALGTLPCFGGRLGSGSNRSQVRAGIRNTTFFGHGLGNFPFLERRIHTAFCWREFPYFEGTWNEMFGDDWVKGE